MCQFGQRKEAIELSNKRANKQQDRDKNAAGLGLK
jgi:hypothetical protein